MCKVDVIKLFLSLLSAARPIIATYGLRISASVYICICLYMYIYPCVMLLQPPGQATGLKWCLMQSRGCCLQTLGAETGRDLGKSTTQIYQVRFTPASRLVEFV